MPDTIREQIIAAYTTRLASWTTAGGFNYGCGAAVQRGLSNINEDDLPACVLLPQTEEVTQNYGLNICTMTIRIEAVAEIGTTNPSVVQERLLGDAIKIMTDPIPYLTLTFAAIGYTSAVAGDVGKTVTGGTTGDTGVLVSYDNTTRKWIINPDTPTDAFDDDDEAITIVSGTGAGTLSAVGSSTQLTSLIDDIEYTTGGPASGFKGEDTTVAVFAEFKIEYNTLSGNPYSQ